MPEQQAESPNKPLIDSTLGGLACYAFRKDEGPDAAKVRAMMLFPDYVHDFAESAPRLMSQNRQRVVIDGNGSRNPATSIPDYAHESPTTIKLPARAGAVPVFRGHDPATILQNAMMNYALAQGSADFDNLQLERVSIMLDQDAGIILQLQQSCMLQQRLVLAQIQAKAHRKKKQGHSSRIRIHGYSRKNA